MKLDEYLKSKEVQSTLHMMEQDDDAWVALAWLYLQTMDDFGSEGITEMFFEGLSSFATFLPIDYDNVICTVNRDLFLATTHRMFLDVYFKLVNAAASTQLLKYSLFASALQGVLENEESRKLIHEHLEQIFPEESLIDYSKIGTEEPLIDEEVFTVARNLFKAYGHETEEFAEEFTKAAIEDFEEKQPKFVQDVTFTVIEVKVAEDTTSFVPFMIVKKDSVLPIHEAHSRSLGYWKEK